MAPEREIAFGSPQDSICITTATKLGSKEDSFAHRMMSFAQYWTSLENTGEIRLGAEGIVKLKNGLFEVFGASLTVLTSTAEVGTTKTELSATGRACVTTGKGRLPVWGMDVDVGKTNASLFNADVCSGALSAKIANRHAMKSAASGGIQ